MLYTVCKAVVKHGQHTLRCLHCANTIHLGCQYKLLKDAGNDANKIKVEWLSDFIEFTSLAYRCKPCLQKK